LYCFVNEFKLKGGSFVVKSKWTAEQLTDRWEAVRAIENLMGRRTFAHLLKQDTEIWNECWCRETPDPCLGFNHGYYQGYDTLNAYFQATEALTKIQTECVRNAHPELAGKPVEELFGVGSLNVDSLSTPLIELAEDGQTAKGLWYLGGGEIEVYGCGPVGYWNWGRVGVDFVKEKGEWKIWHMVFAMDLKCQSGSSWKEGTPLSLPTSKPEYAAVEQFLFPEPNVPMSLHEYWSMERQMKVFPPIPCPYSTFADTFSYGV
jgi:hypothetical protein